MGLVALAAKMAKADGVVVDTEVAGLRADRRRSRERARPGAAPVRARHETSDGFEAYARQIGDAFKDEPALLEDVLDGLFHIAKADEAVHEAEYRLPRGCGRRSSASTDADFERIAARHVQRKPTIPI